MEEDEICRVCRSEASTEEPLFHPCKCSGSIRFVHQDCLMDWLSHSNKKYCELCNHYYKFTPVYKKDMPPSIPKRFFIQHLKRITYTAARWILRACLVAFIWLGIVPYITVWIWRFYFWGADTTNHLFNSLFFHKVKATRSETVSSVKGRLFESIIYDCFQGWLIDFVVIVIFIAGFLLREWVLQNVPTELHDDDLDEQDLHVHEPAILDHPIIQPQQHEQRNEEGSRPHMRRGRMSHTRRPPLLQEPSDYENLEAMWLMDEGQASPPRRDIFQRENSENEHDDEHDEDETDEYRHNPERVQEILEGIRREHRFAQEEVRLNAIMEQPPMNNERMDHPANDRPRQVDQDDNINDVGGGEDIDGILEAIGMRGSLNMLLQNSGLMTFLIGLCLGVGVWLPYVLGVFFITWRPWDGIFLIVKVVQYLSDPIIDYISDYWLDIYTQLKPVSHYLPEWTPVMIRSIVLAATNIGQSLVSFFSTSTSAPLTVPLLSPDIVTDPGSRQAYSLSLWHDLLLGWEYIAPEFNHFFQVYVQMPLGNSVLDRIGCISTGYIILVVIGSLYLSRSHGIYARIGRTARQIIRQLGIFLKVTFFVIVEINIFPLGCGLLLDTVALSLFYNIGGGGGAAGHLLAIHKRMAFLKQNMLSSIFLHWVIGTGFMFLFTSMVGFCRSIVRPGVIWFIRDPNDPQFHPMKELVERPFFTQLQKIAASAVVYGFVIEFGVGGLIAIIGALFDGILPLKWSYTQPLSAIPIDLLFVMLGIPAIVEYFELRKLLENLTIRFITWLCRQLRLTSFLLGNRPAEEEGYIYYKSWRAWIQRPELNDDVDGVAVFVKSGQLVRAPKHDSVRYVPGRRMLVPVDPVTLEPVDEFERELGHPAGDEENNTTITYIPPHFKFRMATFMFIMWVSWSSLVCCLFVGPIALGRWLFDCLGIEAQSEKKILDIYAYVFGGTILIFIGVAIKELNVLITLVNRSFSNAVFNLLKWIFNLCILSFSFGFIIPLLFGCILEFYVILPFQDWGAQAPVIDVLSVWANGLVCLTLFHGVLSVLPTSGLYTSFERIQGNGIKNFNFKREMKELIGPIVLIGLAAIVLPYLIVLTQIHWLDEDPSMRIKTLQVTYPAVLIGLVLYYFGCAFTKFGKRWSQSVREDHYLVGRVLHNMEEIR